MSFKENRINRNYNPKQANFEIFANAHFSCNCTICEQQVQSNVRILEAFKDRPKIAKELYFKDVYDRSFTWLIDHLI